MYDLRRTFSSLARARGQQSWTHHVTSPLVLFPVIALLILGVIWAMTLHLIGVERAGAEYATRVLSQELASTYEAQVVRAMREIDQTLKFVKYVYELKGQESALQDLKARGLLPPELLFAVNVLDRTGSVVTSTRASAWKTVADRKYFEALRQGDTLTVSRPQPGLNHGVPKLEFGRRLNAKDGSFAGAVTISVDADYFVSGYEKSKFGEQGVLGILGADGVFRARRTGDAVFFGETIDYALQAPDAELEESRVSILESAWDGVRRYTTARKLYDFPLTVIVGLAEQEQLAVGDRNVRTYLWWAFGGSVLLLLSVGVLGRMSWQLDQSRKRTLEAQMAHGDRLKYEVEVRVAELRQSKDEAEKANAAKSKFLASMSHELRTPLNAVMGFGQILEMDESLDRDQHDSAAEIVKAGQHLLDMISELLDLTRIESGNFHVDIEPVDCERLVAMCLNLVQPLAEARHILLDQEDFSAVAVWADPLRLKQVIINLLSNAIKYNREGGFVRVRAERAAGAVVRILVQDSGDGIPPARLPEVFQPFNRLGAETGAIEGTGIGLAICKRIAEMMKGRIGVETEVGQGCTFWIELPHAEHASMPVEAVSQGAAAAHAGGNLKTILYVEDNATNLALVKSAVAAHTQWSLISATSAESGLGMAAEQHPDLILLDINLPGMDGFEALRQLRSHAATRDIPVIAVTANAMPEQVERGRAAGFADYLIKPLNIANFLFVIGDVLQ